MTQKKAVILVGVSASGKSTRAKELVEQGFTQIERDMVRFDLMMSEEVPEKNRIPFGFTGSMWKFWNFKHEKKVDERIEKLIEFSNEVGRNLVLSDTNLNSDRRKGLEQKLKGLGYEVTTEIFGIDQGLDVFWKRDANRQHTVGHDVIAEQYAKFRKEFPRYLVKDTKGKPPAVIFDVDGTLAHMHGKRGPFEWHNVGVDDPDLTVFSSLVGQALMNRKIIVLSGRDEVCRKETADWIEFHLGEVLSQMEFHLGKLNISQWWSREDLFMRPENDQRSDVIIKNELFFEHIDGKYNVEAVFDDRPKVCRGWYDLGLKVIHCGNPWIEF